MRRHVAEMMLVVNRRPLAQVDGGLRLRLGRVEMLRVLELRHCLFAVA